MALRDVLLSLAVTDLFRARWTSRIQDEWLNAVIRDRPELADSLCRARRNMEEAVPDANVTGYEGLIESLHLPDPKDRHVLAAAIVGRADVIVTTNVRDFPPEILGPLHLEAQHPDLFISRVSTLAPLLALPAIREMRARFRNPTLTPGEYLELLLRQGLPQAVTILRGDVGLI